MPATPEARARENIDRLLALAGWVVQDRDQMNLGAARGVAVREFALKTGFADYLLFVDRKAIGAVEAKKEGTPLAGVEAQSAKYGAGLPDLPPAWRKPLPFLYESTGVETYFTNGLDPDPRSRRVFAFHRPETLAEWAEAGAAPLLRSRLRALPPLAEGGFLKTLWSAQAEAVANLERSLAENRPRALIQMATGSGKTFTAVTFIYRLIKFGGARRVLFLVDRNNLGRQTLQEFQQYATPDDGRKFSELYNVQHLQSNSLDPVAKVCITTIQRLYAMLSGEAEFDPANEEGSLFETGGLLDREPPKEVRYNPAIPIEYFDVIVTDECHRSIYNLWRGVLEYFDAFLIGLTATPNKQTFGFFNQNLVMEYPRQRAVADGVNVDGQVYRIRTQITQQGGAVDAGYWVQRRERLTRKARWEQLDEPLTYGANQLDRDVVAVDQIRTVIRTFRDRLFTEIFPGRTEAPKTLIFAKDDSHAEEIVRLVREEFGRGNEFCQKITYSAQQPEALIKEFRTAYHPRIAVTVDMIATGTDIRPLEVLLFMRMVHSSGLFEQMLGRGTRVISPTDLAAVTPGAGPKTHFVIVDAVGVVENEKVDAGTLERKRTVSFEKLLEAVALGARDEDALASLAGRLARLEKQLTDADRYTLNALLGAGAGETTRPTAGPGEASLPAPETAAPMGDASPLRTLANGLLDALDPDVVAAAGVPAEAALAAAVAPFDNPALRRALVAIQGRNEQTIDHVTHDEILSAGYSAEATAQARQMVDSFRAYLEAHRDEITALQLLFSRPAGQRALTYAAIRDLQARLAADQPNWTTEQLWQAYARLELDRVKGVGAKRVLTDLIALVRHAVQLDDELIPFPEQVRARYEDWLAAQQAAGRAFTPEQRWWLDRLAEHVGVSLSVSADDLLGGEFLARGGLFQARQAFGADLPRLLEELNASLAV